MRIRKIILSAILVLAIKPTLLGQSNAWNTIDNEMYYIKYPKDWENNTTGKMGTRFVLLSPFSTPKDDFRENINLIIQKLKNRNFDLDKYVKITEKQIQSMLLNGHLIESKRLTKKGSTYQKLVYSGTQRGFDLIFVQYCRVIESNAYVLTFTCEANQFDLYKKIGEKILISFKLK